MTPLDWLIVVGYGLAVLLLGVLMREKSADDTEYFLAGRQQGWSQVAASTWATKLSALTFIGVPGAAIAGNFAYLQLWFGSFVAAYLVAVIFIPEFYRLRVATVYEYLEHRIGPRARTVATLVFIVSRCLASAVRLAGCAIAVSVFFDLSLQNAIVAIAGIAALYVLSGGLRAVIWTDCLQLGLFLAGAVAAIVFVGLVLPGGFLEIIQIGSATDKFRVFNFKLDMSDATTFWTGNVFAVVLGMATGAADQDIAQRALSCPNARQARIAVITAGAADLISTFLFLSVGLAVFTYYETFPQQAVSDLLEANRYDFVFPHFIRHELPAGLRGALIVALFAAAMSSLDSALSGLASSAYFDLGLTGRGESGRTLVGPRVLVVVFAVVLALIAAAFGSQPSILWFGLKIMGYTYGGLLGLFFVALFLHRFTTDMMSAVALISSILVVIIATQWGVGFAPVPWPFAVVIGMTWTCAAAVLFGTLHSRGRIQSQQQVN